MLDLLRGPLMSSTMVDSENCERIGATLCLTDTKKYGRASFRPADPDEFKFGIQLLGGARMGSGEVTLGIKDVKPGMA